VDGATVVGWVCLVAGLLLIGVGASLGVRASVAAAPAAVKARLDEAARKMESAARNVGDARERIGVARQAGQESRSQADAGEAAQRAADEAVQSTADAKSALEQVGSIVGSLPETLRFPGLLVLVGTVLTSVATIQFGGTSLF
jgi:hypothetical protein